MRFHKAKEVSKGDADAIAGTVTSSLNVNVVISLNDRWYDVRLMTNRELNDFVGDLLRANLADLESGLNIRH
jgi:hypothetical protein